MDNDELLVEIASILADSENFNRILARIHDIEFNFENLTNSYQRLLIILDSLNIEHEEMGKIVTAKRVSRDQENRIYTNCEELFNAIYQNSGTCETSTLIVFHTSEGCIFDCNTQTEHFFNNPEQGSVSWINNYKLYSNLLKLFRSSDVLIEFDDAIKHRLMVLDATNGKTVETVQYKIFERRIFSKNVNADISGIEGRVHDSSRPNNSEWISIFRHNIVSIISAQEDSNKTFTEIFLNINFVIQNTERDYTIYLSGFSFDKISKELKEDRQKYFNDLYQAQDKIKSQVIAVPLSIGTSIYAFFQLSITLSTFYFLLAMIAIYAGFIWWYLILYEKDLTKLEQDIKMDSEKFKANYPKVFDLFENDFAYINKKIGSVRTLSYVIKGVTLIDWLVLLCYVIFVYKHVSQPPQLPFTPKYLIG